MSRRDSRVSMSVRQNDALFEFESFKKKFLLANKHITKLNSTLSVRIEELNAQISSLYVENLRLRASEIALCAQLKREREKSKKVMADAEAAAVNLTKHLGFLRHTLKISSSSTPPPSPPPPRARRPVLDPTTSPQVPRLSRPPSVPGICEEEEVVASSMDEDQEPEKQPSPVRRKSKPKQRLSTSRLPLPSHVSPSPPPSLPALDTSAPFDITLQASTDAGTSRKKPSRRQSGLLNPNNSRARDGLYVPRPASPAFGSPIRRDIALEEEEEEFAVEAALTIKAEMGAEGDREMEVLVRRDKRKGKERESESSADSGRTKERERKRPREDEDSSSTTEGSKLKLKDVTNSPGSRTTLPLLDTNVNAADRERYHTPETDIPTSAVTATSTSTVRTFLSTPATTPVPEPYLPTPCPSSSPLPTETEGSAGGRERRTRKSVNYAEPKLNTKMRKPDPISGLPTATAKKQSAVMSTSMPTYSEADGGDEAGTRSSLEREDAFANSRMDAPLLTPARLPSIIPRESAAVTSVKRKSRPTLIPDDDDSDGAQADVDIDVGRTIGWVNVAGRRRSVQSVSQRLSRAVEDERRLEGNDGRRHSMAV